MIIIEVLFSIISVLIIVEALKQLRTKSDMTKDEKNGREFTAILFYLILFEQLILIFGK
jgi:hypothetical protein